MRDFDLGSTASRAAGSHALDNAGTGDAPEDEAGPAFPLDPFDGGIDLHVVDEEYV